MRRIPPNSQMALHRDRIERRAANAAKVMQNSAMPSQQREQARRVHEALTGQLREIQELLDGKRSFVIMGGPW